MNVPAPLFRDPIYDSPTDPMIIKNEQNGLYYMFYTQRRGTQHVSGVSYVYGTLIGVAESADGAKWHYVGALDLAFEFGHNTYWAPEIIYCPDDGKYHMFVSYIRGIYTSWEGVATIEHYVSDDLFYWKHIGPLSFGSSRIIDPCIYRLPDGKWRMWYKDERRESHTCYADSADLYEWEYVGEATSDCGQEGPNVFALGGRYWLIADVWKGLAVYSSDDLTNFVRQEQDILVEPGTREMDNAKGHHADVIVVGERAFIVYFTHPDPDYHPRAVVQMAELKVENGMLVCDRNAEFSADWSAGI